MGALLVSQETGQRKNLARSLRNSTDSQITDYRGREPGRAVTVPPLLRTPPGVQARAFGYCWWKSVIRERSTIDLAGIRSLLTVKTSPPSTTLGGVRRGFGGEGIGG